MQPTGRTPFILILIAVVGLGGCDFQLGTPVATDPFSTEDSLGVEESDPLPRNPHVGLTAGRIVTVPPASEESTSGTVPLNLDELLGDLASEDADLIRELIEGATRPPTPEPKPDTDDRTISWGELKRRYAPAQFDGTQ